MNLRIKLVSTSRTDVLCVSCGKFGSDHVIMLANGTETDSGVHKRCAADVAAKFTRKRRSVTEAA